MFPQCKSLPLYLLAFLSHCLPLVSFLPHSAYRYTYSLPTVLYINRRVRTEGLTQDAFVQDLVDRRHTTDMTQPLLTVTEVHAEVDDGTPIVPVEGGEAPKIDTVPEAEQV